MQLDLYVNRRLEARPETIRYRHTRNIEVYHHAFFTSIIHYKLIQIHYADGMKLGAEPDTATPGMLVALAPGAESSSFSDVTPVGATPVFFFSSYMKSEDR
jgi:hypothetical protein